MGTKRAREHASEIGEVFAALCECLEVEPSKEDVYKLFELMSVTQPLLASECQEQEQEQKQQLYIVYVLELKDGKYYIGRSDSDTGVDQRIAAHKQRTAAMWTTEHAFVKELSRTQGNEFLEDNLTLQYMQRAGMENVRGGSFCSTVLPEYQQKAIRDQICTATGCCYKCLRKGHFRTECPF